MNSPFPTPPICCDIYLFIHTINPTRFNWTRVEATRGIVLISVLFVDVIAYPCHYLPGVSNKFYVRPYIRDYLQFGIRIYEENNSFIFDIFTCWLSISITSLTQNGFLQNSKAWQQRPLKYNSIRLKSPILVCAIVLVYILYKLIMDGRIDYVTQPMRRRCMGLSQSPS